VNQTLETIAKRRSVRAFSPDPISQEEKDIILQAAFRAPTAGNLMLYSIIEVEDPVLKEKLSHSCDEQPFIAKAPYVLVFLADYQRWYDFFQASGVIDRCKELGRIPRLPQEGDLMLACCDALIAAQNAVIAAESLGISSCYIGDVLEKYEIHRELLALPRYAFPITLLCFGHPKSAAAGEPTPRFDRQYIVHKNQYHQVPPEEMGGMMKPIADRYFSDGRYLNDAQNIGQHYYFKKFTADFSIEMNRSVREILKNWQER
jgi:nitroreductase